MANDMLTVGELAYLLPNVTQAEVDAAIAAIRGAARWHIAPVRTETTALDVEWAEPVLRLPTLRLESVEEVRDAERGSVVDPSRYRVSHARARIQRRGGYWPSGYEAVEVDMIHGYEKCPLDLHQVIVQYIRASRRDKNVRSVRIDDGSIDYSSSREHLTPSSPTIAALADYQVLQRYSLPEWPGMA